MNPTRNSQHECVANPVGVQFLGAGRVESCDAGSLALQPGDHVLVQTEKGARLGVVVSWPPAVLTDSARSQRVVKKADTRDLEREDRMRTREHEAVRLCLRRIRERGMKMKLIKAEQAHDGGKVTFYFTADGRVDFRELVRDLAHGLHMRIEMKQIGPRDEAKLIGAVGPCGRELCCSSFLSEPGGVSVKMARAQGLSPNPSKLAGMCGRLKCCLRYEYDTYLELNRALPAVGTRVVSVQGEGSVARQNALKQTVLIRRDDGGYAEATLADLVEKRAR